ncbi:helix-turn-helix domain-containing protein [Flavobacterium petrolei]|uniref:helix-turn-helix domain-containing protein n=1 Tax=Flavobacterium petrolei TaxID=2259594 RepID=UPI003756CA05
MKETNEEMKPIIKLLEEMKSKFDSIQLPKKYYRNKNLKEFFGLSDNTIISYRDQNILPFTKLGEIYYYPITEIDNLLSKNSNFDLFGNRF